MASYGIVSCGIVSCGITSLGYAETVHWMPDIQESLLCERCNRSYSQLVSIGHGAANTLWREMESRTSFEHQDRSCGFNGGVNV